MADYFVYRHIREDNGETFYVGCGKRPKNQYNTNRNKYQRAYEKTRRNKSWQNVLQETDYTVEILYESKDKKSAFSKEIEYIAFFGRKHFGTGTLVNISANQGNGGRRITQLNNNGEVIKIWENARAVENANGFYATNILKVCRKKQVSAYGYLWKYTDNDKYDSIYAESPNAKSYVNNKGGIKITNRTTGIEQFFRNQHSLAKYLGTYKNNIQNYLKEKKHHPEYIITYRKPLCQKTE